MITCANGVKFHSSNTDMDFSKHTSLRTSAKLATNPASRNYQTGGFLCHCGKKTSYHADTWIELKKSVSALFQIRACLRYQTEGLEAVSDVASISRVSLYLQSSWSTTELKSGGRTHVSDGDESNEEKLSEKESSSQSSYNPSSQSSSTEIVTSHKPIYSYLTSAGIEQYTRPTKSSQWMIGEVDLTEKFLEYRALIVDNARKMGILSQVDQLALNFIYLISNNSKSGNLMDGDVNTKVSNDLAVVYRDVYHDILRAYSSNYSTDCVNEDTYVHDALQPLLKAYFPNDDVICREGANGTIKASSSRKQKFNSDSHGRKGDCSVKTNDGCLSQLVLLVEAKSPLNTTSNDLVKLGKCLKNVVDKLDEDGVRDVFSLYDVGFVEFAKNFTASKAQKDRVKLILEGKETLNTVFKVIGKYVPDIEFYTLQIAGLKGHLISTTLQSNGLYTVQNINNRIRFPLTKYIQSRKI
ncbi:hypothetical protein G6F70_008704 [Rhizopus microsporus]|nr:hypothetical protein G6F71_008672 [Rhizopus microsporus]KAG1194825.1 hypothetical protein G6F70_008704 [Rhizopus microsporus]KAG1206644.1 hypothetical protein G6F69_008676 [Rhizopus microsporus]KAG1227112.1 hypothetical protein G6F67_008644 [Rhizopus microsporus]KAG1258903.1 hypothetical protein G6F68_008484 [Rhizopus microsporus]